MGVILVHDPLTEEPMISTHPSEGEEGGVSASQRESSGRWRLLGMGRTSIVSVMSRLLDLGARNRGDSSLSAFMFSVK